jgi:hypothetical protein
VPDPQLIHILLTLDYEIFGNGAGDVRRDVVEPTRRLLALCERHTARITIMFEVGEYWAFQMYDEQLCRDWGYSPCREMESQMIEAIERGHDVQLHLHPLWIGARYEHGGWQLNGRSWRLADLPHGLGDPTDIHSITGALSQGKWTLERMLRESRPDYRCTCFRAGGFCAQPSGAIIRAMKRAGILLDSSVVKGYRRCRPWLVDYSQVSTSKPCWWTTEEHLSVEGDPGVNVLELPVSSQTQPYWKNLHPAKLRTTLRRRQRQAASSSAAGTARNVTSVPTFRTVLGSLFRPHCSTLDYCKLTGKDMWRRIDKLRETGGPVVLIGHAKDFFDARHLQRFLAAASQDAALRFSTFSEYLQSCLTANGLLCNT